VAELRVRPGRTGARLLGAALEKSETWWVEASGLAVHLTPEAEERLGGPAWFDRAGADARVGPLYALYREPGRHVVALELQHTTTAKELA